MAVAESDTPQLHAVVVAEPAGLELPGARRELVAWAGASGAKRTFEFLGAEIRNKNTRRAYNHAAVRFMRWCTARQLQLIDLETLHVAAYIEELALGGEPNPITGQREPPPLAPPSVKLHLAALKHWFDYLVVGHVLTINPADAVRGQRYSQSAGKTPVLEVEQVRALFASIAAGTLAGARDKALIAVMLFSFARIGAVVGMRVRDYQGAGTRSANLNLHEKGGKFHRVPAHHLAAEYLEAYIKLAGLRDAPDAPLWQGLPARTGKLTGKAMSQRAALDIIKRRCMAAGLPADICNHSFRATGITIHQDNGGDLEAARQIANHSRISTTQIYNRSGDKKKKAEIERVQL